MNTEIIAWVVLSILGIVTIWLGYSAVEMYEWIRKSLEELKKEIEPHEKGIEMIAEKQSKEIDVKEIAYKVSKMVGRAEMLIEFGSRPSHKHEAITLLCEAAALIAAKIDRVNNLKLSDHEEDNV